MQLTTVEVSPILRKEPLVTEKSEENTKRNTRLEPCKGSLYWKIKKKLCQRTESPPDNFESYENKTSLFDNNNHSQIETYSIDSFENYSETDNYTSSTDSFEKYLETDNYTETYFNGFESVDECCQSVTEDEFESDEELSFVYPY